MLLLGLIFELIKRPVFWVLYPLAYAFRKHYRTWPLDDSIRAENLKDYGLDLEYCYYGKRSAFVEKWLPYDFCRSFYWGAWRNNGINLMIALEQKVGTFVAPRSYKSLGGKSFYTRRTFSSCRTLPYLEYWIGKWRLQCGWISCGRFQVQFRRLG